MATQKSISVAPMKTAEGNAAQSSDISNDTALMLQPYSNWEQFLMPGPSSVHILGQLIFLSAREDFAIDKMVPKDGFKYIKYPKSFRASLVQVSNEGWEAFQEAHNNMDQIRLLALNVTTDMTEVMMILAQDDPMIIADFLQIPLESIQSTAGKCLELSKAVKDKFTGVIDLISELLEACTGSKGEYEEQIKEIKKKKEMAEMQEKAAREAKAMMEEQHRKLESQLEQAQKDYKDSMDSIPVGWNAVAMTAVESFVNALTSFSPAGIAKIFSSRGSRNEPSSKGTGNNIIYEDVLPEVFKQMLHSFQTHDEKIDWEKLNSNKGTEILSECKQNLKKFQVAAGNGGDCPEKVAAPKIFETGIGICEELENLQKSKPADEKAMADLAVKIKRVLQDTTMSASDNKAKARKTPPRMSRSQSGVGASGLSTASLNARFKAEQFEAQLQAARKLNEESFEDMKKKNEEIQAILEILKTCDVQEIDFKNTVAVLRMGLDALGRVKEQWVKMVQLFSMLSNLIGGSLNPPLYKFLQYSKQSSSSNSQIQFAKKLLQMPISQATKCASIVHMITETYVQVSSQHLMGQVSSLGKLMGLDPNPESIKFERDKFDAECDEAQKAIENLAKASKERYEKRLQARIDRILNSVID
ncbi:uncharacterized protein LOC134350347 [Mobula hypostoma]|uniref:uncharacterized protein LOC134350347 n=1 Tax=Mobula hypostoma TaxID=723540 RepID=UPI002FC3B196